MERITRSQASRHPNPSHPPLTSPENGSLRLKAVREVGDDQDLGEWLGDEGLVIGVYQAQQVASESLRLTRHTLAQIDEDTEQFVSLHPAIEASVREMTQHVSELLVRVPERAVCTYLTRFDEERALRWPEERQPQPGFWERLRVRLPRLR